MFRVLRLGGHLCWQVGNHVFDGEVTPLDLLFHPLFTKLGFVLQRRFIWTFGHGLHCQNRFSGRYETISWYTKGVSRHLPHPPAIVASEWSTLILDVPNVKSNHVEKTSHPCQFPVELVERFVLALTDPSDVILDPFGGAGSTVVAAVKQTRRGVSIECVDTYVQLAKSRLRLLRNGCLSTRPMGRAICDPASTGSLSAMPPGWSDVINPSCAAEQDFARTGKVRQGAGISNDCHLVCLWAGPSVATELMHSEHGCSFCLFFPRASEVVSGLDSDFFQLMRLRGYVLRNRVVFSRLVGYDVIFWFTMGSFHFDLDAVRVPSKYPGKRSTATGKYSGNPLGKNPSDFWEGSDDDSQAGGVSILCLRRFVRALCPVGGCVVLRGLTNDDATAVSSVVMALKRDVVVE